ncbi:uncharacterized protein SOCE26_082910 [Sorangium cellulosum]|uniref:Uncharacterized protein n=1 Tax=Sorangium cellulosum TaxID=56 RepID=A0A2L0F5H0_SORCE|nr:hypothetical protein [Sorangium cellulosum]AUX46782.1 uncharacterized protein SOCE26_082910 [Sorangium cellulosum]
MSDWFIGVGLGTESPPYDYTGSYREQTVTVDASPVQVDITTNPPLGVQEDTRIGILPIRRSINYVASLGGPDPSNTGVLSDDDITDLLTQARATSARWLEPLSYGLARWTVEVLPTVEDVPMVEQNHDGWVAELGGMRPDLDWPAIGEVSENADLYLGVFPVLRRGFHP